MDQVVGLAVLAVSLALLWARVRHLEFGSFLATVVSLLELLALGIAVYSLGWPGLAVLGIVNVIAVLVWSVLLASRVEAKLVYAGIQADESKETMKQLASRLGKQKELKVLGPVQRAELVRLLADRNRTIVEIEDMAAPIGMLKTIHDAPLDWLTERFDGILRGAGESRRVRRAKPPRSSTARPSMRRPRSRRSWTPSRPSTRATRLRQKKPHWAPLVSKPLRQATFGRQRATQSGSH